MRDYIFYADRIVSISDPYLDDDFVLAHHRPISLDQVDDLLVAYKNVALSNRLLTGLLEFLSSYNGGLNPRYRCGRIHRLVFKRGSSRK